MNDFLNTIVFSRSLYPFIFVIIPVHNSTKKAWRFGFLFLLGVISNVGFPLQVEIEGSEKQGGRAGYSNPWSPEHLQHEKCFASSVLFGRGRATLLTCGRLQLQKILSAGLMQVCDRLEYATVDMISRFTSIFSSPSISASAIIDCICFQILIFSFRDFKSVLLVDSDYFKYCMQLCSVGMFVLSCFDGHQ